MRNFFQTSSWFHVEVLQKTTLPNSKSNLFPHARVHIGCTLLDSSTTSVCIHPLPHRLPLLCQGPKWLNGKSIWLVFRRSWLPIPAGSLIFSVIYFSLSQHKNLSTNCCHQYITSNLYTAPPLVHTASRCLEFHPFLTPNVTIIQK